MFFSDVPLSTFALLMLPAFINLWSIYHATRHTFPRENERALWLTACIFLPVLGGVLYLLFGLRRARCTLGTMCKNDNTDKSSEHPSGETHNEKDSHNNSNTNNSGD